MEGVVALRQGFTHLRASHGGGCAAGRWWSRASETGCHQEAGQVCCCAVVEWTNVRCSCGLPPTALQGAEPHPGCSLLGALIPAHQRRAGERPALPRPGRHSWAACACPCTCMCSSPCTARISACRHAVHAQALLPSWESIEAREWQHCLRVGGASCAALHGTVGWGAWVGACCCSSWACDAAWLAPMQALVTAMARQLGKEEEGEEPSPVAQPRHRSPQAAHQAAPHSTATYGRAAAAGRGAGGRGRSYAVGEGAILSGKPRAGGGCGACGQACPQEGTSSACASACCHSARATSGA